MSLASLSISRSAFVSARFDSVAVVVVVAVAVAVVEGIVAVADGTVAVAVIALVVVDWLCVFGSISVPRLPRPPNVES